MFATVAICALVELFMQAVGMRVFPHVLKIPYHYMYSALIVIALISAYVESGSIYKCGMMLLFGGIGIIMSYCGLPTSPLILSFILGPILELNMLKAFQYTGTVATFFTRPISGLFMVIGIGSIFSPMLRKFWSMIKNRKQANAA
jgi:putative tricarboxylic transport membrane protein